MFCEHWSFSFQHPAGFGQTGERPSGGTAREKRRGGAGGEGGEVREGKEYRRGEGKEDCMQPKGHSTFMCTMASPLHSVVPSP